MTGDQLDFDDLMTAVADSTDWTGQFLRAVESLRPGARFTAYEIADGFGLPDPPNPRSQWGAATAAAKRAGLCRRVGYEQSKRPTTRGSAVVLWEKIG